MIRTDKGGYMEQWKPIEGTNGKIEVSNQGRVRSLLRGYPRVLLTQVDKKGYHRVRVSIAGEKKTYKLHREVAKAFLPNIDNLPQVNHKDGDKSNNNVTNLEWVTNAENARHAIRSGLWDSVIDGALKENERRKKPIIGYRQNSTKNEAISFSCISDAERYFDSRHICDVLKGKRKHVKGWEFRYEEVIQVENIDHHAAERQAKAFSASQN